MPSGKLPVRNAKFLGKFALVNLQPIKLDKKADLVIHTYVDDVLERVLKRLGIENVPDYEEAADPTRNSENSSWDIDIKVVKELEMLYKKRVGRKRKTDESLTEVSKKKKIKETDKTEKKDI